MELNTQDMLLSGDSQQLRRREQKCVSLGENCLSSLAGERTQKRKPQVGTFWLEDASHMWGEYSMQAVWKISRKGRRRKKEGEIKKKE